MKKWNKMLLGALACISIFAAGACADEGMGHEMEMSQKSRDVIANPKGTLQSRGVISLQDYVGHYGWGKRIDLSPAWRFDDESCTGRSRGG